MTSSLKIGAISGLVAGFIGGIVSMILAIILPSFGLHHWAPPPFPIPSMTRIATIEPAINTVWGIALGLIYPRIYDLIPGKGVSKGLSYGLAMWLIHNVHIAAFMISYAQLGYAIGNIVAVSVWITYGLALGILFEFLQRKYRPTQIELEITKRDIRRGVYPGAFAAFVANIVIVIAHELFWNPISFPEYMSNVEFLVAQFGTHGFINMVWGIGFGMLYVMFFDRIPGKRISKGIIFAMIISFILNIRWAVSSLSYGDLGLTISFSNAVFFFLVFGIILGALYKK